MGHLLCHKHCVFFSKNRELFDIYFLIIMDVNAHLQLLFRVFTVLQFAFSSIKGPAKVTIFCKQCCKSCLHFARFGDKRPVDRSS